MKVLITGGSGFLGAHLIRRLGALGWEVVAPRRAAVNLCRLEDLARLPSDVDLVVHLAAWTQAGDWCLTHPGEQWLVNQQINTNVLTWWHEQCQSVPMIAMGTSCSYAPGGPLVETEYMQGDPIESLYTYALTKRMLLQGLRAIQRQYGGTHLYLVPSTLYGAGYHTDGRQMHFIFDLARKILRGRDFGEPVVLWGDGHQRRELVHVDDFITNLMALVGQNETGVFNLGAGEDYSIREFARVICDLTGYDEQQISYDTSRYVGAASKILDVAKAKGTLSDYAQRPLADGMADMIGWFEETRAYV